MKLTRTQTFTLREAQFRDRLSAHHCSLKTLRSLEGHGLMRGNLHDEFQLTQRGYDWLAAHPDPVVEP